MNDFLRLAHTLRTLRPRQLWYRLVRPLRRPRPELAPPPPVRPRIRAPRTAFRARPASYQGDDLYVFLNQPRRVKPEEFALRKHELLWDYNFHYFDGLFGQGTAEGDKRDWIARWLCRVPPGSRPAWDPYPTSRRILNWVKWDLASSGETSAGFRDSLAAQARYLSRTLEYDLLANHLLANATALVAAGCLFGGEEGDAWLGLGSRLLERELDEQFLDDGAHYELSPAYHCLVLEDLLDLLQIAECTDTVLPDNVHPTAEAALRWLSVIVRPDGRIPLFNDASYDMAGDPAWLAAYARRLGVESTPRAADRLLYLRGSGYFKYDGGRMVLIGDVGPLGPSYQPGHGHCDMLSYELCWDGRPCIVDTGTSTYEVGPRRSVERGTAAHNTVQIGQLDQSEIWAGFRAGRRAQVERVAVSEDQVVAVISAFPQDWHEIERRWTFADDSLEIHDRLVSVGLEVSPSTSRIHFHPDIELVGSGVEWRADGLGVRFEGADSVRVEEYAYAPEFNRLVPARRLCIDFRHGLRTFIGP